ncbi:MAG TPA: hypothetical protein VG104_10100 [Candidatus Dormibacteraeota bacterium]|nr:hypothetical protein [Candidatus Dormibacteraeota bacterium]
MRGVLVLGALFVVAFVLTRANSNAGLFLFLAVVCVGVVLVSLFARGLQRFGGTIRSRTGGSERDLVLGGLLLITLLTPWAVAVPTLGFRQIFGWQSPLALLVVAALVAARLPRARRLAVLALLVAGLGMVAWAVWATAQLLTPSFRHSGFGFLPIDLIGEGWYIALLAFVISVDRLAVEESADDRPARPREVWPFAVVAGMGLVRMRYLGRGRLWTAAFGFCVFLLQTTAVGSEEFQYYGSLRSLPEPRARGTVLIPVVLGLLVWVMSLWDTRQQLRLERI